MEVGHIAMIRGDPNGYLYTGSSVAGHPGHYDFLNGVAFGHKELWQTLVAYSLSVTSQMLWHLATTNYGGIWP